MITSTPLTRSFPSLKDALSTYHRVLEIATEQLGGIVREEDGYRVGVKMEIFKRSLVGDQVLERLLLSSSVDEYLDEVSARNTHSTLSKMLSGFLNQIGPKQDDFDLQIDVEFDSPKWYKKRNHEVLQRLFEEVKLRNRNSASRSSYASL